MRQTTLKRPPSTTWKRTVKCTRSSDSVARGPGVDCGPAGRCYTIDSKPLPLKNSGHGL
jgi:hypothetical protein